MGVTESLSTAWEGQLSRAGVPEGTLPSRHSQSPVCNEFSLLQGRVPWVTQTAQWVKVLLAKPSGLISTPSIGIRGENWLQQAILGSPCTGMQTHVDWAWR